MPRYSRLTREKRYTIEAILRNGGSQKEIAMTIGCHPSSVSRELRRNGMIAENYCHSLAQNRSKSLQSKGKRLPSHIWPRVECKLRSGQWSPEQISAVLRRDEGISVSHETIYRHIYSDRHAGGSLHKHLRHQCKSYRKRGLGRERRGRIRNQVSIDERPTVVDERSRLGDWELDTMIGKLGGPVLITMVERKSRYTLMALAPNKEAKGVAEVILAAMSIYHDRVKTLTFDNGMEFAKHEWIGINLKCSTYFAHPYSSWERGLNENTNGLIRQYFPKGYDFGKLSELDVKMVEYRLNHRPRKCLDFYTPHDMFHSTSPIALAS